MADNVQITHIVDTRANITSNKRKDMLAFDTTNERMVIIKTDGTTERDILLFDSNMDAKSNINKLLFDDNGYVGLGDTAGRVIFDDAGTDGVIIRDAELIVDTAGDSIEDVKINRTGITFHRLYDRLISIGASATTADAKSITIQSGDTLDEDQDVDGGDLNLQAGDGPASYENGSAGDVNIKAGELNGSVAGNLNVDSANIILTTSDIYSNGKAWQDYSGTSTITGWAATPTASIFYKKLGRLVFCSFSITGTSNSVNSTFTLPHNNNANVVLLAAVRGKDNGTILTTPSRLYMSTSSAMVTLGKDWAGATWTSSGSKKIDGGFWYLS